MNKYTIQVSITGEQPVQLSLNADNKIHASIKVREKITDPFGAKLQIKFV